jgi:hypothetical protein
MIMNNIIDIENCHYSQWSGINLIDMCDMNDSSDGISFAFVAILFWKTIINFPNFFRDQGFFWDSRKRHSNFDKQRKVK